MQAGSGRLVVSDDGTAVLVLDELATVPAARRIRRGSSRAETPVSAGTFASTDGSAIVPIPQSVPDGAVVAVTVEQAGGASSPTLPLVAASDPV